MGKKGRRNRAAAATSPTPERSAFKPRPPPSSIHVEKRPVPDIREGTVDVGNLQLRISALLPTPNRQPGSLPTTAELKKLNKTGQRLARDCALLERVSVTITSTSICDRFGNEFDPSSTPIGDLIQWDEYMQGCVDVIEALSSTDFRVGPCVTEFIKSWPVPSPFFIPTSFHALGKEEYQLGNVSAQAWVVLLANLMIHLNINMVPAQAILRLVHELYLHADTMDWSELKSNSCTESLDENTCRFALASAGIKICRRLYRLDNSERAPSPVDAQLSTCMLLDEIETFSREQMKFRPDCATGHFNMGWVAMQCPSRRKTDPVAAAADCLHWYTKAYEVADCDKDDFVSAAARIEAAASIGLCAAGAVGITVDFETAVVRRDFRSEFGGMMKKVKMNEKAGRVTQYDIIDCLSSDHARKIMEYESDRVEKDIPPTAMLKGECHVIEVRLPTTLEFTSLYFLKHAISNNYNVHLVLDIVVGNAKTLERGHEVL